MLNEVMPFGNMPYKMGVINLNMDTPFIQHVTEGHNLIEHVISPSVT